MAPVVGIVRSSSTSDLNNNNNKKKKNNSINIEVDSREYQLILNNNNDIENDSSKTPEQQQQNDEIDKNIEEFCKIPGEPNISEEQIQSHIDEIIDDISNKTGRLPITISQVEIVTDNKIIQNNNNNNNNDTNNGLEDNSITSTLKMMESYKNSPLPKTKTIRKEVVIIDADLPSRKNSKLINLRRKFVELIHRLKWSNIFYLTVLHIAFIFACIHCAINPVRVWTVASAVTIGFLSGMGMSVGAHRYWAHRSFKAHTLFRLELMLLQTMTMNGSIFSYSRDHRNHHKYSDTAADPKNPARGLFHAHVGWWCWKKSPIVITMGKKFDVSDLWNDKMVWFQHNFYTPLFLVFSVLLPTIVPWLLWNENLLTSFYVMVVMRVTIVLHLLFCVNSLAHHYGYRPYDFRIRPADNRFINYLSMGEGNHNYHHVFPYDYRSNDKAYWEIFDPISGYIKVHEILGLAHDCKRASPRVIEGIIKRKGIPAYFDKKRSFKFRVCNAIFDWIVGSLLSLWMIYPFIVYKILTGQQVLYFDWT